MASDQNQLDQIKKVTEYLSDLAANEGNFEEAYMQLRQARNLSDSIYTLSLSEATAQADAAYENSLKEAQILAQELELARQRNRFNQALIIGAVLFILLAGLYQYRRNRDLKAKAQAEIKLEKEKALSTSLKSLDQLKTNFFNNITHELRTPLTLIKGPLQRLQDKTVGTSFHDDISGAYRNSNKLLSMVNEIMELARIDAKKLKLNLTDISAESFLRRVFFAFESLASITDTKLIFESDLGPELVLRVDEGKLEKIINNLMTNAIRHDPQGEIKLQTTYREGWWNIIVKDHGAGISPEDLPYIFNRFFQSSQPNKDKLGSAGIGLALVQEYLQLMGGGIKVISELSNGSEFSVEFPADRSSLNESSSTSTEGEVTGPARFKPVLINGSPANILIVEDDLDMSMFLQSLLSPYYQVSIVSDGSLALSFLQKKNCDMIISDIMMPVMDGITLKEKLREFQDFDGVPFIFLTAKSLDEHILEGLRLGVDDYITKPFNNDELLVRVENVLNNRAVRLSARDQGPSEGIQSEEGIIQRVHQFILENIDDSSLAVPQIAREMGYSERQLRRRLKAETGLTPVEFILEIRLLKARDLIERKHVQTVSEAQYEVGIESASYFSSVFARRFGKNPSELINL